MNHRPPLPPCDFKDFVAVDAEQGFIGRNDLFAGFERCDDVLPCRADAAHQFDDGVDFGIGDRPGGIVVKDAIGQVQAAVIRKVAHDGMTNLDRPTSAPGEPLGLVDNEPGDAGADVTETDDREMERAHGEVDDRRKPEFESGQPTGAGTGWIAQCGRSA